jgi:hypothetical protein
MKNQTWTSNVTEEVDLSITFNGGQTSIMNSLSELSETHASNAERIEMLESENLLLKLRLLKLEAIFNNEEVENLKCMLRSVDPASVQLAKHIIKNA